MSAILPSQLRIACPLCSGDILVPRDDLGQIAACPHCAQEIILEHTAPLSQTYTRASAHAVEAGEQAHANRTAETGAIISIFIPLVGIVVGIVLIAKGRTGPGITCLVFSVLVNTAGWFLIFGL